jgi:UDP-glucose 4-epimerase
VEAMRQAKVTRLVFSSTAAVYGDPVRTPIDEAHPTQPVNPYGSSKLAIERMLAECSTAYGIGAVVLRYFNAAGADPSGELGERHEPETHLIPLVLQAASGRRPSISVFGNDWPTRDGSCVRDYIHVSDLCVAHQLALDWLAAGGRYECFNLGNGEGATVLEVIEAARRVTGRAIKMVQAQRRVGDPPSLVADASKARRVLGWQPARADIEGIVRDAWKYEQRRAS